ncbi:MAG: TIGR04282 family arsenosugar biosynthesis glycosyltransferase [Alphaproteobacteria bacterium]
MVSLDGFAPRLVIMAKRPVAGGVKRRLARDIGTTAATRFYRTALTHTLLRLSGDLRWRTYLAVTPDTAFRDACWPSPPRLVRIAQGHGDLGARMQGLFDALPPGPVVVIGSDIPAVRPDYIAKSFELLGRADAVFGPAEDGGYWLVGMRRVPRRLSPFEGVPWSTDRALTATIANLRGQRVAFAPALSDVDMEKDYARQRRSAERLCALYP